MFTQTAIRGLSRSLGRLQKRRASRSAPQVFRQPGPAGRRPSTSSNTITDPAISGFVADELSKSDRSQSHIRSGDGTSRLDIFAEILAALQGTPARYHNSCRGQLRSGLI